MTPQEKAIRMMVEPMYEKAALVFPSIPDVRVALTWDAGTSGREFAFFDPGTNTIGVSPRLLRQHAGRIAGVLRHEMGHVVHESVGRRGLMRHFDSLPFSDEILADQVAEFIWGAPIFYDSEDVQTVDPTRMYSRVRPSYLPNPQIDLFTGKEIKQDEPIDRAAMKQLAEAVPEVELEPSVKFPEGEPYGQHLWPSPALFDEGKHFQLRPYFLHREPTPNVMIHRRTGRIFATYPHPFTAKYGLHVAESLGDIPVKDDLSDVADPAVRKWVRDYQKKMRHLKLIATCPSCGTKPGVPCLRPSEDRPSDLFAEPHMGRVEASEACFDDPEFRMEDIPGFA